MSAKVRTSVTKIFKWDAAHRIVGHGGACAALHGHTYKAEVTLSANSLDGLGMVVDFGFIKRVIGNFIDEQWDHNLILAEFDPLCAVGLLRETNLAAGKRVFVMGSNPTAENMAQELFFKAAEGVFLALQECPTEVRVDKVTVWETPTSFATVTRE
jgi:6-pyruvoyltetrahydropterin/6-carboxytetrahydropterin synthase